MTSENIVVCGVYQ